MRRERGRHRRSRGAINLRDTIERDAGKVVKLTRRRILKVSDKLHERLASLYPRAPAANYTETVILLGEVLGLVREAIVSVENLAWSQD